MRATLPADSILFARGHLPAGGYVAPPPEKRFRIASPWRWVPKCSTALLLGTCLVHAALESPSVVSGSADISNMGSFTTVRAYSREVVLECARFSVSRGDQVRVLSDNNESVVILRVIGTEATHIMGDVFAEGTMHVENVHGIEIAEDASIHAQGLFLSSGSVTTDDSRAGSPQGHVLNRGHITADFIGIAGVQALNYGVIKALGAQGGSIEIHGESIGQFGTASADGSRGDGGTIVMSASDIVVVGADSVATANAGGHGDGGKILVIGHDTARIATGARIEARGGSGSGDGGFVETSGRRVYQIGSGPDVSAPSGNAGTWYIDPHDITIRDNADAHVHLDDAGDPWTSQADGAIVDVGLLTAALDDGATVWIQTQAGGTGSGNLTVVDPIVYDGQGGLTLEAHNNIVIGAQINNGGPGSLTLLANSNHDGSGDIAVNQSIFLAGGALTVNGVDFSNRFPVVSAGGRVVLTQTGNIHLGADINAGAGDLSLTANGAINQTGGTLFGGDLSLTCHGGIGSAGNRLTTFVNTLAFDAAGDVYVTEANALTVAGGSAVNDGLIDIATAAGRLTVGSVGAHSGISAIGGGHVVLTAGGASSDAALTQAVVSTSGDISITAARNIYQDADIATSGDVTLTATTGAVIGTAGTTSGSRLAVVSVAGIALTTDVTSFEGLVSGDGNVSIVEKNAIDLVSIIASKGRISVAADQSIVAGSLSSVASNVVLHSTSGNIEVGTIIASAAAGGTTLIAGAGRIMPSSAYVVSERLQYDLYAMDDMSILIPGKAWLSVEDDHVLLQLQPEQSRDLLLWEKAGDAVEWRLSVPSGKQFFRLRAHP